MAKRETASRACTSASEVRTCAARRLGVIGADTTTDSPQPRQGRACPTDSYRIGVLERLTSVSSRSKNTARSDVPRSSDLRRWAIQAPKNST